MSPGDSHSFQNSKAPRLAAESAFGSSTWRLKASLDVNLAVQSRSERPTWRPQMYFSMISASPNLDVCNTLHCFYRFFNILVNCFDDVFQASKYLSKCLGVPPKCSQSAPKTPQEAPQTLLRRSKKLPRCSKDAQKAYQNAPRSFHMAFKMFHEAPKRPQEAPPSPEEAPTGSQEVLLAAKNSFRGPKP